MFRSWAIIFLIAFVTMLALQRPAAGQGVVGAVRWSTCVDLTDVMESPVLCNVTGFMESPSGLGVLLQVTPRLGLPTENWQLRTYTTRFSREIGALGTIQQVGVTTGRESGVWFARFETDIIVEFSW